ncbi:MAG: DNA-binding protein [Zoogloea sp.]|nr:DNA-binding protein [Zoogloea sp.]
MTLENLLAIHRLVRHEAGRDSILKLLAAAARNLADSKATNISAENRFDAAYKAILQCAMAALWLRGYRTPTSEPGHHMTAIQTLPKTLGVEQRTVIVLDALRKQRNLSDYEGDSITDATLAECISQAEAILKRVGEAVGNG